MKFAGNLVFFIWKVHLESPTLPSFQKSLLPPSLVKNYTRILNHYETNSLFCVLPLCIPLEDLGHQGKKHGMLQDPSIQS